MSKKLELRIIQGGKRESGDSSKSESAKKNHQKILENSGEEKLSQCINERSKESLSPKRNKRFSRAMSYDFSLTEEDIGNRVRYINFLEKENHFLKIRLKKIILIIIVVIPLLIFLSIFVLLK